VFVSGIAGILRSAQHDRGAQPGIGREHAAKTDQNELTDKPLVL